MPASIADRVSSGDELVTPASSRLELISGNNVLVTLGGGARLKLNGLRVFTGPDGKDVTRLDVGLLAGEVRIQVRLNQNRPESVLVDLGGADVLVTRGDVDLFANGGWRGAVLAGEAQGRVKRASTVGAPFSIPEGATVGSGGESPLRDADRAEILRRIPFHYEMVKSALPPLPPMSMELEAP